jgi:hypothetical protein
VGEALSKFPFKKTVPALFFFTKITNNKYILLKEELNSLHSLLLTHERNIQTRNKQKRFFKTPMYQTEPTSFHFS